jgi:hypothetical protein
MVDDVPVRPRIGVAIEGGFYQPDSDALAGVRLRLASLGW